MLLSIVFFPLIGAIISGFLYRRVGEHLSMVLCTSLVFFSMVFSWTTFLIPNQSDVSKIPILTWISSGDLNINWSIRLDGLTEIMLIVICTVSFVVHLYSFGYMKNDHNNH